MLRLAETRCSWVWNYLMETGRLIREYVSGDNPPNSMPNPSIANDLAWRGLMSYSPSHDWLLTGPAQATMVAVSSW